MNATIYQTNGYLVRQYGPYSVSIGPDFDECGLDRATLDTITSQARSDGADTGYCDIIVTDESGAEIGHEIAVI